jgi:outer membrane protein OmpA-like peptidoglycan-associated protein
VGKVFSQDHSDRISTLSTQLKFKHSQSLELKEGVAKVLDTIAIILKSTNDTYIIQSYSGMRGKSSDNLIKTQKRAAIIKEALIDNGVHADRLLIKGFGETNRLSTARTRKQDLINERIKIIKIQ